jgi:hypothetical protein
MCSTESGACLGGIRSRTGNAVGVTERVEPPDALGTLIAGRDLVVEFGADVVTVADGDSHVARMTALEPGIWAWRAETRTRALNVRYERSSLRERLRWSWRVVARDSRDGAVLGTCSPRTWRAETFDVDLAPGYRFKVRRSMSEAIRRPLSRRWELAQDDGTPVAVVTSSRFRRFDITPQREAAWVTELALLILLASTALVVDSVIRASGDTGGGGG